MTSKERVLSALNHKQPDKVPLDFGGCTCSCMHVTCVEALREQSESSGLYVKLRASRELCLWQASRKSCSKG